VTVVASVVVTALTIFWVLLIIRLVFEYVFMFARQFRPSGALTVLLEVVYSVTDPPLKALRKVIPPLRLGTINLDLSFLVLFIFVGILRRVIANAAGV